MNSASGGSRTGLSVREQEGGPPGGGQGKERSARQGEQSPLQGAGASPDVGTGWHRGHLPASLLAKSGQGLPGGSDEPSPDLSTLGVKTSQLCGCLLVKATSHKGDQLGFQAVTSALGEPFGMVTGARTVSQVSQDR